MSFIGICSTNKCKTNNELKKLNLADTILYFDGSDTYINNEHYYLILVGRHFISDYSVQTIEKELEKSEGTFAYCLWFKKEQKLIIGTDKLGFYPLYYNHDRNGFKFSNFLVHLKPFLAEPKPCWDAWDEILNEGDVLGDKTPIKDVYRLRQGQKLVYCRKVLKVKDFWKFVSPNQVDKKSYITENNSRMLESLRLLNDDNMIIPSTGGHDSRRIIISAHKLGHKFSTITQETEFKEGLDVDSFIAKKVATKLNIKHHLELSMPDSAVFNDDSLYKDRLNGFESANHGWAVNLLRHLPKKSSIYDGIVGDIIINNHFITDFSSFNQSFNDTDYLIKKHLKPERFFSLKSSYLEQDNYSRVKNELIRFENDANRFNLFKTFNHTRRNIGHWYSPFLMHGHKINLPYCYTPLFIQSFSLDYKSREYAQIHLKAMEIFNKEIASLPSTRTHEDMNFWRKCGVPQVRIKKAPIPLINSPIPKSLFKCFNASFKSIIFDQIAFSFLPNKMLMEKPWRYEPLQRLHQFLVWLETDHSQLPILHKEPLPYEQANQQ